MRIDISNRIGTTSNQGGFKGLLDVYSGAAAAYSLRKLSKATTSVVRVRRDSDNAEADFTALEITDGTLAAFCTGTDGLVTTWYDQSGNGNDATQGSASSQPKIVSAGVLVTENGKPAVDFDGTDDFLEVPSSTDKFNYLHDGTSSSVFMAAMAGKVSDPIANYAYFGNSQGGTSSQYIGATYIYDDTGAENNASRIRITRGVIFTNPIFEIVNDKITSNQVNLISLFIDADNATASNRYKAGINGDTLFGNNAASDSPVTSDATYNMQIGMGGNNLFPLAGYFQEVIFFNSDQSGNRVSIEGNINGHYNIYS